MREKLRACLLTPLKNLCNECFAASGQDDRVLHLHLEIAAEETLLSQYPWELLHGDRGLHGDLYLSRYIRYPRPKPPLQPLRSGETLRVLVVHSEPAGMALGLEDYAKIRQALSDNPAFRLEFLHGARASLENLRAALQSDPRPTVIHFAGHGDFGLRCEACKRLHVTAEPSCEWCGHELPFGDEPMGYLAFTRESDGQVDWVGAERWQRVLANYHVPLVVLNACKSAAAVGVSSTAWRNA